MLPLLDHPPGAVADQPADERDAYRALAREVAARNITVNAVAPGFVPTALTNGLPQDLKDASLKAIPLGRWGTPEDVAFAVGFLAAPQAGYITGQVLSVDGGMVMS